MEQEGSWGTDTEIYTFTTICNTTVFAYCNHMKNKNYVWLLSPSIHGKRNDLGGKQCIYNTNIGNHYGPVFDVAEETYTRTPYIYINNFVIKIYEIFFAKNARSQKR